MNKEVRDALEAERRLRILTYILSGKKILSECRDFLFSGEFMTCGFSDLFDDVGGHAGSSL